jgi:hypothetical protein
LELTGAHRQGAATRMITRVVLVKVVDLANELGAQHAVIAPDPKFRVELLQHLVRFRFVHPLAGTHHP